MESIGAESIRWSEIDLAGAYLRGLDLQTENSIIPEQLAPCDYLGAQLPAEVKDARLSSRVQAGSLAQWRQAHRVLGHQVSVRSVAVLDATRVVSGGWDDVYLWTIPEKASAEPVLPERRVFTDNGLVINETRDEVVFTLTPDASPPHFICSDGQGGRTSKQFPADPRLYRWLLGVDENGEHFPGFAFADVWNNLDAENASARWEDFDDDDNPRRLVIRLTAD